MTMKTASELMLFISSLFNKRNYGNYVVKNLGVNKSERNLKTDIE